MRSRSVYTPSLIVAPAVDVQYHADDTLGDRHADTLQARILARLASDADGYDIPVLVTRNERKSTATYPTTI
jgi:phage FluMu gp28-like protein